MKTWMTLLPVIFLAGCSTTLVSNNEPSLSEDVPDIDMDEDIDNAEPSQLRCAADQYQNLIGQLINEIHTDSLPVPKRVYSTTDMVTQDYRPERLNIVHTPEGRVSAVMCG